MRRGGLVTLAVAGDLGKPRPAVVIRSDRFVDRATVTLLLLSWPRVDAPPPRLDAEPDGANKLRQPSQVMADKAVTVRRDTVGAPVGRLDDATVLAVDRALVLLLGLA